MSVSVFDKRACLLGEGPLWHPERGQLFWFDILGNSLMSKMDGREMRWSFDEHVSAAGWTGPDSLLIASETALFEFDLTTGQRKDIVPLEADISANRSNDGRADPWGGFWIGTMGKNAETRAGAIYRYYQGELRQLIPDISVSNAICFAPDRRNAYYTDSLVQQVMRLSLDADGWPGGEAEVFLDLTAENLTPDGADIDSEGCMWLANWGAGRVARYGPDGACLSELRFPASQMTCPAFGGEDYCTLFATSATTGVDAAGDASDGMTFAVRISVKGLPATRVVL